MRLKIGKVCKMKKVRGKKPQLVKTKIGFITIAQAKEDLAKIDNHCNFGRQCIGCVYFPQSFSGGGLYSSGNRLLLIDYDWLLIMVCVVTVTFFDSYCNDGVSAGIWVIHTGPKSGGELVTLFDSYCNDGVSAVIGVQYTEVPNLGASWSRFLTVTQVMVLVLL